MMLTGGAARRNVSAQSASLAESDRSIGPPASEQPHGGAATFGVRLVGRFGWALTDQLLSSATNFLLALLVARTVGPRELGAFSMAYATFTCSLGAVRAIAGDLLVVRYSAVSADLWRDGVKRSTGTALMAGAVIGGGCLIAAGAVGAPFGPVLGIVGVSLPFLLVQDVGRFAFFARGRGSAAFLNDLVWAVMTFGCFGIMRHFQVSSVSWFTLAWAAAGILAAIVGMFQLKVVPSGPWAAAKWLRHHRDIAQPFFAEFAVGTGVGSVMLFAIGAIAGLGEVGRLRAGEIALGPLNVLFAGVGLVATAESVRLFHESPIRFAHACRWLSLAMAAGVLAWGAVILFDPYGIGALVLRANWDAARSLVPLLLIALTGYGFSFGGLIGLRAMAAAKRSLGTKCIDSVLTLFFGLTGAYLAGATGVAWGYAVTGCLRSLTAWWQFSRAFREHERRRGAGDLTASLAARA